MSMSSAPRPAGQVPRAVRPADRTSPPTRSEIEDNDVRQHPSSEPLGGPGQRRRTRRDGPERLPRRRRRWRSGPAGPRRPRRAAPGRRPVHRAHRRHRGRVPQAAARAGRAGRRLGRRHRRRGRGIDGRAGPAGRDRRLGRPRRPGAAPQPPGRRDLHRLRQGHRADGDRRGDRRGHRHLRRRADPQPAAQPGGAAAGQGRRPDRADPGHLRPARPVQGGQGAGRARPAELPGPAAARLGCGAVPAARWPGGRRRRHRLPRSR